MWRFELAVYDASSLRLHVPGKVDHGKFRCARHEREHAVSDECPAAYESIKSSDQLVSFPYLDALGVAVFIKQHPCVQKIRAQPCIVFLDPVVRTCASGQHISERFIDCAAVSALVDHIPHRMGDMYLICMDDESFLRRPPYYRLLPESKVGEYAHRVALGKPFWRNFPSDGIKTVRIAVAWVGECICMV